MLCPGVRVLPTDCDGVAQDNEIGTSPSGGAFASPDRPDRKPLNLERQYNDEFTAGVQHQVTPRLAVGAMFYKRKIADLAFQDRTEHHARPTTRGSKRRCRTSREIRTSRLC